MAQNFVPIELLSCMRLKHLSFIGCQGLFLPPVIGELIALESLRVNDTDLTDTRDAIHPATFQRGSFATYSLIELDLSTCNLDVLPFQASYCAQMCSRMPLGLAICGLRCCLARAGHTVSCQCLMLDPCAVQQGHEAPPARLSTSSQAHHI